ncbi:RNA 3'-terminal phosphate cyclase-like protein [Styela clava]
MLEYVGANYLRQRLVLSILSGKPVRISSIRDNSESPGLNEYEANLLRFLEKITNGTTTKINVTGTTLIFRPGLLIGGVIDHDCNPQRSISYLLEVIFFLAPFCKERVKATLRGVTNDSSDPTVDFYRLTSLPVMRMFGVLDDLELKVIKRGFAPEGGGEVFFQCPNPRKLRPLQFFDQGKIKRIRGTAFASNVSPQIPNRVIESSRSVLNTYLPDIYIYADHLKGNAAGKSPGFGIVLTAETTTGVVLAVENSSNPKGQGEPVIPEELGTKTANDLLEEIFNGGCVDSVNQGLAALFMVLCEQDVSKLMVGSLTDYTIELLRHIRDFFQVMFKLETKTFDHDEKGGRMGGDKVIMTCVGIGYSNISKTMR